VVEVEVRDWLNKIEGKLDNVLLETARQDERVKSLESSRKNLIGWLSALSVAVIVFGLKYIF
jgi:hypothetical protein